MNQKKPSPAQVRVWLTSVEAEIDSVSERLAPLLEERDRLKTQTDILRRLLSSLETGNPKREEDAPTSVREHVVSSALRLLEEEGGPLHINELHARFLQSGLEVPGAGAPVNITAHIRNSAKIVSPSRGVYDLASRVKDGGDGNEG